jgi:TRAP-type C4-dicarboxylate transport system substrate-binding protein
MQATRFTSATLRIATAVSALSAALALVAWPAQAQDKPVNLKMSSWVPAQHPLNPSLQAWADDIKKASNGTITATLFPSEQLGKAFDHYDMARDGIADFAYINPGYQPGRFPIMAGASLPFLFANGKSGSKAIDEWYRPYAAKEMKDVHFCFAFVHDPGTFHARKKILLPTDIKGMKIRPATSTIGQMVTTLGGTNVQASAPESRDMLERGVADAITFPWGSVGLFGIDKVVSFHMDAPLYVTPFVWAMNKDVYDGMSAAQKKVIDDHCTSEWAERVAAPWADFEYAGRAKIAAEPGHEIYKLTPEQLDAWRKAVAPVDAQWADSVKKVGQDPKAVMDGLKASLAKNNAAL